MPVLSEKLRRLRQLFGYSQEYIAFNIGMTQPAYCKWESGQTQPSINKLEELANIYQLSLGDLLNDDDIDIIRKLIAGEHFAEKLLGRGDVS
ncbi:helix-turn-helix domain-containing protein [Spirosoma foliorum]|uniref:Helix-turn-helix transcriptional regulator n=1 Tax=Spirosoma foliorum TaxID=2710596 RepID=A0A7G5GWY2_9BACT|nr:helix-turn-helix transcriptional regulator [Spirosoma foliorum]QMW03374.1 helix-turn-helix transcriptional regulator [Spirosoma foliorum]QMW03407.1 helix-turn-helix transcriptional regulator [Spirosoma foliorum]